VSPLDGIVVVLVLGAVIAYRRRRLAPDVPRNWRTSQASAARLCRRLHRAVDRADGAVRRGRKRGVPVAWFENVLNELRGCASAIDQRLVVASELPTAARHRSLHELRYRVVDVEKTATRVERMVADAGRPDTEYVRESVEAVNQRLDRLEDARRELRDLG
jgi:hypothetical protein